MPVTTRALLLSLLTACRGTEIVIAPPPPPSPPASVGALRVTSSMSGSDIDRDGVVVTLDDTIVVTVASSGTYLFTNLATGSHGVRLSGVRANCSATEPLQRVVEIHTDTTAVGFSFACTKAPIAASGLIAFARGNADHTWDVWVMNGDGTGATQLRESPNLTEFEPAWTPDGQFILFAGYLPNGSTQIARIDRLGQGFVALATGFSPSVSADGQRIVFAKEINGYDIWVMNIDGTNQQSLTTDPAYEDHPSWSPDGTRIVFERGYRLFVMNANGTNPHSISAPDAIEDRWPSWSPDGTKILFIRRGFGQDHVYTIQPDGTKLTQLTTGLDNDDFPAWSADGSQILFSSGRGGWLGIWSMRSDGTELHRLSVGPPTPYDSYPAASR